MNSNLRIRNLSIESDLNAAKYHTTDIFAGCFASWGHSSIFLDNFGGLTFQCRYTDDMELDDAVHTAILTLKEGYVYFN